MTEQDDPPPLIPGLFPDDLTDRIAVENISLHPMTGREWKHGS